MTTTAARITWLLPDPTAREAYEVHRMADDCVADLPCLRCGGRVTGCSHGNRAGLVVRVRDRGTSWRNAETVYIHRGCIPPPGDEPQRIRPRRLPAIA